MIVLLSGPEKVGKSTLAGKLHDASRKYGWHVACCNFRYPSGFSSSVYRDALKFGTRRDTLVIMDRGWPDGAVYDQLLDRRPSVDETRAEWCFGVALKTMGVGIMMIPPHRLGELEADDHVIDYEKEAMAFRNYGGRWGYDVVDPLNDTGLVERLLNACEKFSRFVVAPPQYVGPPYPEVMLIGEKLSESTRSPYAWVPMSTYAWDSVATVVGNDPRVGRTNAAELQNITLIKKVKDAARVVAFGVEAEKVVRQIKTASPVYLPHPAAVCRWGRYEDYRETFLADIRGATRDLTT